MNKKLAILILYWFLVSIGISTLIKPSFMDFWISWFIALVITPGSIILYYGYRLISKYKGLRYYIRFFLLVLIPILWSYYTIFFAFWYILELQRVYIPIVLLNPLLLGIILGFFAIAFHFLNQKLYSQPEERTKTISIYSNRIKTTLKVDEIVFIESRSDHTIVHLLNETSFRNSLSISSWEDNLSDFLRIHRSFLVNPLLSTKNGGYIIVNKDNKLPISRTYRSKVEEFFKD